MGERSFDFSSIAQRAAKSATCIYRAACVVYLMEQVRRVHQQNKIIYTVVACFLAGLLAQACVGIGFGVNLDLIMIGDIMLFIPGLVIVNGVREFFYADILTGLYRLVEALLIAGAIAAGYAVSLMMGGSL